MKEEKDQKKGCEREERSSRLFLAVSDPSIVNDLTSHGQPNNAGLRTRRQQEKRQPGPPGHSLDGGPQ